jgi:competence protein ComEA
MAPRAENTLTAALVAVCLLAGAVAATARLAPRPAAVAHGAGDLTVSVHGEVARPGVYRLAWGSRVADLLATAGGVTPVADIGLVDVAAVLTDGRTVIVPSSRSPEGDGRIDVNTASERLLTSLPGVGPVTAARIIARRPYHRLEDLLRVPGIGPARLAQLSARVTVWERP